MHMSKPKVLLTRRWPEMAERRAAELFDAQLSKDDHRMSSDELCAAMQNYDAICPTVSDLLIDSSIIDVPKRRCKILCNFGVGFNNINTEAAKQAGLVVTNTPGVLTQCTADIAMTLLLMVARRAAEGERLVRDKTWDGWRPMHMLATRVSGKKLGLIGFGRIAQAVAQRAHFGFGMQIGFYDPYPPSNDAIAKFHARQYDDIESVLKDSDFVSLHCPGGGANTKLINSTRLAQMQAHAFLINTARGDVVDEAALSEALQAKRIMGAGLDVFEKEPTVHPGLLDLDNVVMLPHLGSATAETRTDMGFCSLENAQAFFDGAEPPNRIV
ncbi:MAG: 2-hydroxyacid dehydrogenase [Candidatus Eutrophobiaceae bacterium]